MKINVKRNESLVKEREGIMHEALDIINKRKLINIKVIIGDVKEISRQIAEKFIKVVNAKPNAVLGLATGTSPLDVYANLAWQIKKEKFPSKVVHHSTLMNILD